MSTTENQQDIPELENLAQWAIYDPEKALNVCDALAGQLNEKPAILTLAKNIVAFTVVMTDEQSKDRLIGIFEKIVSSVDGWNIEDKKWFSEKAGQACANAHQMCARHGSGAPSSLRHISAAIDQHTARIRNEVIAFAIPPASVSATAPHRPAYDARFGTKPPGAAEVITLVTGSRLWRLVK